MSLHRLLPPALAEMILPRTAWAFRLVVIATALACGVPAAPADVKRVAIVYSDTSRQNYWGDYGYYQLFMAMQYQCAMTGVPYDLLDEDDLASAATLAGYDAVVIPLMNHVPAATRPQILAALNEAATNGLSIVTSGWFLSNDPAGGVHPTFVTDLANLIGIQAVSSDHNGVPADVLAADVTHPAMPDYQAGETIRVYNQIWTTTFTPAAGTDPAGSSVLCNYQFAGSVEPAVLAITFPDGRRNVHFANEQIMQDTNVLWSALRWALFGDETPVSMRLGRQRSLFFARNDMDQSQYAAEVPVVHVPLLDIITEWKDQHGFVGSYYINVGNDPGSGAYTDWSVSGPLYHQYEALGSEIGTHSYTHPSDTSALTAAELEFEFHQSVLDIEANFGSPIPGGAVPGNPENQFVRDTVAPWLTYLSGRAAIADTSFGYSSAFGRLRPGYDLFYYCLNTSPDFTLIGFLGYTAEEAQQIWLQEYAGHHEHAPLPVVHWLWHDYGPVPSGASAGYTREMYDAMISTAAANGSEFVTGIDLYDRVEALQAATLDITQVDPDTIMVQVTSTNAGRFCLALPDGRSISSVADWYAYDGNKLFLPKNGGSFSVHTGGTPAVVTRIVELPPRAELLTLQGDGTELGFTFDGEGEMTLVLNETGGTLGITGADAEVRDGATATLSFDTAGPHSVSVALLDSDGDGHLNTAETTADTDGDGTPNHLDLDSDDDGLPDASETFADFDGDMLPNIWDPDSDNDTMPDGWETDFTLDALDPGDATLDSDGDGQSNAAECASGHSPLDASDSFAIGWEEALPFRITVDGKAGRTYTLQRSTELTPGSWSDIDSVGPLAGDQPVVFTDPSPPSAPVFYRAKVVKP